MMGLLLRDEDFVELLAGTDPGDLDGDGAVADQGLGDMEYSCRGHPGDKRLAWPGIPQRGENRIHASSRLIRKRVISGTVTVTGPPFRICS